MPTSKDAYAGQLIGIAQGRAISLGKAKNRRLSWKAFRDELAAPQRTQERFAAFLKLPKEEQDKLKAVNGWLLGGEIEGDRRKKNQIKHRYLITLDCDEITPDILEDIRIGVNPICRFEFVLHSTRKHQATKPRIRIFLLCESPVEPDQYDAVARILAEMIDPTMDSIDDVSFRLAQMMFRPSASRDQEYLYWHNPGERVNAPEVLESFRLDWRDYRNLPYSEARGQRRKTADKAEDPTQKHGPVGAFCRAYDVEAAMEEFIPEVYLPGDTSGSKPRYSYAQGTTSNGVVVEDGGLFIYSHHGSDPCGERLCNAFDMVRIHKFGHLDEKLAENANPKDWPSFKAMVKWAEEDEKVKGELLADRVDIDAMFDDLDEDDEPVAQELRSEGTHDIDDEIADLLAPSRNKALPDFDAHAKPPKPARNWPQKKLELNLDGTIKVTTPNIATILTNDPRLWGKIGRNTFSNKITVRGSIKSKVDAIPPIFVKDTANGEDWTDLHDVTIKAMLESQAGDRKPGWGMRVSRADVNDAIILVAQRWQFNPVIEYLQRQTWDGVPRLETTFIRHFGSPDNTYTRQTAKLFFLAAVCRIMNPGHKWDHAPILQGLQGIRKSSWIKVMFGSWAGELTAHMASNKDAVEQMLGKWCLELPELANMRKSESEDVKAFMTYTEDRVRLSYDRRQSTFLRQCIFMGTTNAEEYLKDPTGNRRFWPIAVMVPMINTDMVESERDQIWAEAFALWRAEAIRMGDYRRINLSLTGDALGIATKLQDAAREEDSHENTAAQIEAWLDRPVPLSQFIQGPDAIMHDLESFEGEPMVLRCHVTPRWAAVEGLGIATDRLTANVMSDKTIGAAMVRVSGWRKGGARLRHPVYGQGREYVREDATAAEIERGYRIVGQAGGGVSPSDSVDEFDIL